MSVALCYINRACAIGAAIADGPDAVYERDVCKSSEGEETRDVLTMLLALKQRWIRVAPPWRRKSIS